MGLCIGKASREVFDEQPSTTGRGSTYSSSKLPGSKQHAPVAAENELSNGLNGSPQIQVRSDHGTEAPDDTTVQKAIVDGGGIDLEIMPSEAPGPQPAGCTKAGAVTAPLQASLPVDPHAPSTMSTATTLQPPPDASTTSVMPATKQQAPSSSPTRSPRASTFAALFTTRKPKDLAKPPETCILTTLPQPLLIHMLSLLDLPDVVALMSSCALFFSLVMNGNLWNAQVLRHLTVAALQLPASQSPASANGNHAGSTGATTNGHFTPFTPINGTAHSNGWGFKARTTPKNIEHRCGPRWVDAATALTAASLHHDPEAHVQHVEAAWSRLMGELQPRSLQNLCYALTTGGPWSRPVSWHSSQLQASFEIVLPGTYEVLWWLRLKHLRLSASGYLRFDTCLQYIQIVGEPAHNVEYGNKSTIWNLPQWNGLEQKHGRGVWFPAVVTTLRVTRACRVEVSLKGLDECVGLWAKMVQLRRIVDSSTANCAVAQ